MKNIFYLLVILLYFVDVNAKENLIPVRDGALYYQEKGEGTPIIVVHGGPGLDQTYLQPQLFQLSDRYRVIFYDQRGSGKSTQTILDTDHINIDQFVDDLDVLRKQLGIEKVVLLGHSWGGLLTMKYAIAHPENVEAMILVDAAPADYAGQKAFLEEHASRRASFESELTPLFSYDTFAKLNGEEIASLYRKLFSVYFYDPNQVEQLTLIFNPSSAQSGFKVGDEMQKTFLFQPGIDLLPDLQEIHIPTLIIHGKQDIVPVWTAHDINNAIHESKLVVIDKSGHFPYIEQPAAFFSEIDEFIKHHGKN